MMKGDEMIARETEAEPVREVLERGAEVLLKEMNVILQIPEDAAAIEITARILQGEKVISVTREFNASALRKARQDFLDCVEDGDDYDAAYKLTPKGLQMAMDMAGEKEEY